MATHEDFLLAFELLIGHEGGYVNDPNDPGGETKYGISKRSYSDLDIKNLTLSQAEDIYETDYWIPTGCPDLPPRLALVLFDAAVNNGRSRAVRWLQSIVGAPDDGIYGPATRAAVERAVAKDPLDLDLAGELHARRLHFMVGLGHWEHYGMGWSRRLAKVALQASHHWPTPVA